MSAKAKRAEDDCKMVMVAEPPAPPLDNLQSRSAAPIKLRPPTGPRVPALEAIGDEERVDATDEQTIAEVAREHWEQHKASRDRERRRGRREMTLGQRLDLAVVALEATSGVGASSKLRKYAELGTRVPRSAEVAEDAGPPPVQMPQIDASLTVIEREVERVEAALDAERGLLHGVQPGRMTTEQKDSLVWGYMGVRAADVAAAAPYLGSTAKQIMRAREREAMRRKVKVNLTTGVVTGKVFEGEETPYDA